MSFSAKHSVEIKVTPQTDCCEHVGSSVGFNIGTAQHSLGSDCGQMHVIPTSKCDKACVAVLTTFLQTPEQMKATVQTFIDMTDMDVAHAKEALQLLCHAFWFGTLHSAQTLRERAQRTQLSHLRQIFSVHGNTLNTVARSVLMARGIP